MINNYLQIFNFYFSNEFVSAPTFSHILYTDKDKKYYCSSCKSYKKTVLSHSFPKSWHQENKKQPQPDKIIYSSFFKHNFMIPYMEHHNTNLKITDYYDEFIPELYIQNDCNNKKNKLRNQLYKEHSKNYLKNYKILSFKNQSGFILKNPFINNIDILNSLVFSNFFLLCENCENEYSQGGDNENADFKKETKMNTVIIKKNLNRMLNFFKYNINIRIKKNDETIKDQRRMFSFFTANEKTLFLQTILFEYFDKIYSPFIVFSNLSSCPNLLNKKYKSDNILFNSSFYNLKRISDKFKLNKITDQLIFELNYSFLKKMYSRENTIFYGIDKYHLSFLNFPYGCAIPMCDLISFIHNNRLGFLDYIGNLNYIIYYLLENYFKDIINAHNDLFKLNKITSIIKKDIKNNYYNFLLKKDTLFSLIIKSFHYSINKNLISSFDYQKLEELFFDFNIGSLHKIKKHYLSKDLLKTLLDKETHSADYLRTCIHYSKKIGKALKDADSDYLNAFENYDKIDAFKELQISEHFTYFGFSFFNPLTELSNNLKNIFGDKSDFEKCSVFILSIPKYGKIYIFSSEKNINLLNDFIENNIKLGFSKESILTYFLSLETDAVGSYNKKNISELIQLNKITSSFQSNYEEHYNKTVNFITKMDLLNDE